MNGLSSRNSALSRKRFLSVIAACGGVAAGMGEIPGVRRVSAQSPTKPHLVIITLDAFRPDYRDLAPMPNLASLSAAGITYDRAWVGQLESNTPTSHVTIGSGVFPRRHGIVGFEWRDPATSRESLDGWAPGVLSGHLENDLRVAKIDTIAAAVRRSDPSANITGVSSEKVYAAFGMGGPSANYVLYCSRDTKRHLLVTNAVRGHRPPDGFFTRNVVQLALPRKHLTDWDYLSANLALDVFAQVRPRVLMVNLPGADIYGHEYGGPASPKVMRRVVVGLDRNLGRIIAAYKKAGLYDQTIFVVTADHGMVPNDRTVSGDTVRATVQRAGGDYYFHTGGTAAYIYLRAPGPSRAVAHAMAAVPNVSAAYYRTRGVGGIYSYTRAPDSAIDPSLDAAYGYLLSTFVGAAAPDVVAQYRENTIGTVKHVAYGYHGGLNWGAQAVPLIISGPGVRAGTHSLFPARLVDVAPTVLHLMGLSLKERNGVVLADALSDPAAASALNAEQSSLAPALRSHVEALMGRSTADIQDDQKSGVHPPAAVPVHP